MKMGSPWLMVRQACPELDEGLTTSGMDPVRPEALEGRNGLFTEQDSHFWRLVFHPA